MKRLRDLGAQDNDALVDVNMSPLVDMVFLLLIFFMVTSVFVEQQVVDINSPNAKKSQNMKADALLFSLDSTGQISYKDKSITIAQVKPIVLRALSQKKRSVVLVADLNSVTKDLVTLMDECRLAGAEEVSLATDQK